MLGFHPYFDFRHNYNGRAVGSTRRPQFTPMEIPRYVVAQKNKSLFRKYLRPREGYNTRKCSPQQTIQQWSEVQCTSCLDYIETRNDARKIRGQPYRRWIFTTIQDKNVRTQVIWSKVCELQFQKHLLLEQNQVQTVAARCLSYSAASSVDIHVYAIIYPFQTPYLTVTHEYTSTSSSAANLTVVTSLNNKERIHHSSINQSNLLNIFVFIHLSYDCKCRQAVATAAK